MIFGLFRKKPHQETVARLHGAIVAQSRLPAFFLPPYGAPDTFEGRFEIQTLNAGLVLRRLSLLRRTGTRSRPGAVRRHFSAFDDALREIGVSDVGVPKKMKKLAGAFMGRGVAYAQAMEQGDAALAAALARNVLAGEGDGARAGGLCAGAPQTKFAETPLETFLRGEAPFPAP